MSCNKVVLVTGSSTGIGAAVAILAAHNGYSVSITARCQQNLEIVKQQCIEKGLSDDQVLVTPGDLTDPEVRKNVVDRTIGQFGRIDVLVNNAGFAITEGVEAIELEKFDKVMDLNLRAAVDMSKLCLKCLVQTKGTIINMSSVCGKTTFVPNVAPYCMSKAALDMFTQCLALELAPKGVRVNSVNPAVTRTPAVIKHMKEDWNSASPAFDELGSQHPLGRVAEPVEIAEMVMFLASDKAAFITGQQHYVDGGILSQSAWARRNKQE